jgi:hypothetical protein
VYDHHSIDQLGLGVFIHQLVKYLFGDLVDLNHEGQIDSLETAFDFDHGAMLL